MSDTIYADHAAATPLEPEVWEVMCYWLTKDFSNPAALYRSGIAAHQAVERARQSVAECLRCSASQIYFTSGVSESNTWAILSGASRAGIGSREVVTTPIEHHSVGRACASLKNSGIAVYTLPVSEEGKIDLPAMIAFTETFVRTLLRGADEQESCLFGAHYSCGAEKPSPNFLNSLGVQPI